jgi:SepF-like predicted cell division protein (DUF552 family)
MGTLWQFFGFPDPEVPPADTANRAKKKRVKKTEAPGQQLTIVSPDDEPAIQTAETTTTEVPAVNSPPAPIPIPKPIRHSSVLPKGWTGPVTPDGIAFHDLSNYSSKKSDFPDRALRYVEPDKMHRLPLRQIEDRMYRGDTIIVDLNGLIHMDTQTNACRRTLKQMGDEVGIDIFALDDADKLLLVPGKDVTMDVGRNDLGLMPLLM